MSGGEPDRNAVNDERQADIGSCREPSTLAWLATLLFLKVLVHLRGLVKPIAVAMPEGLNHPMPWSILAFALTCFAVGLLVHTAMGKPAGRVIEQTRGAEIEKGIW
jgi:hypothetical protein